MSDRLVAHTRMGHPEGEVAVPDTVPRPCSLAAETKLRYRWHQPRYVGLCIERSHFK